MIHKKLYRKPISNIKNINLLSFNHKLHDSVTNERIKRSHNAATGDVRSRPWPRGEWHFLPFFHAGSRTSGARM